VNDLLYKIRGAARRGQDGFTLLEIIVAFALIATAVLLAVQLFSANLRAIATSESHMRAAAYAGAVMREITTDEDFPNNASTSGFVDIYRFETSAVKVDEERNSTINADLYRIDVTLSWREGNRDKTISLSSLKLVERRL
jgi:general secretion pathway protein I